MNFYEITSPDIPGVDVCYIGRKFIWNVALTSPFTLSVMADNLDKRMIYFPEFKTLVGYIWEPVPVKEDGMFHWGIQRFENLSIEEAELKVEELMGTTKIHPLHTLTEYTVKEVFVAL